MANYTYTYQQVEDLCIREFGWSGAVDDSGQFLCFCPIHGDKSESLAVKLDPVKGILIACRSHGCAVYPYLTARRAWPQQLEKDEADEANRAYIRRHPNRESDNFVWNSVPVSLAQARAFVAKLRDTKSHIDKKTQKRLTSNKTAVYIYTDGTMAHSVVTRYDDAEGIRGKEISQSTFGFFNDDPKLDGKPNDPNNPKWYPRSWSNANIKHMLYAITALRGRPDSTVVIVEGEKAADYGNTYISRKYPEYVFTTWKGGARAVTAADWSELDNRDVIILPDNDEAGYLAASGVKAELSDIARSIRIVDLSKFDLPRKWDVADYPVPGVNPPTFLELIGLQAFDGSDGPRDDDEDPGPTHDDQSTSDAGNKLPALAKTESNMFWYKHDQSHTTDMLRYMERYAQYTDEDGSVKVIDVREHANSNRTPVMTVRAFREATLSIKIQLVDKGKPQQASDVWLGGSTNKIDKIGYWATTERVITEIDGKTGAKITKLNMWTGPAAATAEHFGDDTLILEHIKFVFSGEKPEIAEQLFYYFMCCMAEVIQNPDRRRGKIFIFGGAQGSGKSMILKLMYKIFGPQNGLLTTNIKDVVGEFNHQLCGKSFIGLDEVSFRKGDLYNRIKGLSTGSTTSTTEKGKTTRMTNIFVWFMATTNDEYMAPIADSERRIIPVTVPPTYSAGHSPSEVIEKYFDALNNAIENTGGAEGFYKRLMEFQLPDKFPPMPQTRAHDTQLRETQSYSKSSLFADWYEACLNVEGGRIAGPRNIKMVEGELIQRKEIWAQVEAWQKEKLKNSTRGKELTKGEFLKEFYKFCSGRISRDESLSNSPKGRFVGVSRADISFKMPNVDHAREVFEEVYGKHSIYDIYPPEGKNDLRQQKLPDNIGIDERQINEERYKQ